MTKFHKRARLAQILLPIAMTVPVMYAQTHVSEMSTPAAEPTFEAPAPVSAGDQDAPPAAAKPATPPGGNRVAGVLPNYRTATSADEGTPISARHKMYIASRDSFDYPLVGIAAIFAGFGQLSNANPSFGQGMKGYGHRLVTNYSDLAIGNMLAEGVFPALLHEDPRYFRRGTGSTGHRVAYALTRIIITDTDHGKKRFNYSEWLGNGISVGVSNAYYPDSRTVGDNITKLLTQCATDAASQVLKEFWPDIKKKFLHKD